jgi:hypothetical protein
MRLAMDGDDRFFAHVAKIYDAALDPERWPVVLADLARCQGQRRCPGMQRPHRVLSGYAQRKRPGGFPPGLRVSRGRSRRSHISP